jgi:hypothetical protein
LRARIDEAHGGAGPDAAEVAIHRADLRLAAKALAQLRPDDQLILRENLFAGRAAAEIGAEMGWSTSAAERRLSRAKARLRTAFEGLSGVATSVLLLPLRLMPRRRLGGVLAPSPAFASLLTVSLAVTLLPADLHAAPSSRVDHLNKARRPAASTTPGVPVRTSPHVPSDASRRVSTTSQQVDHSDAHAANLPDRACVSDVCVGKPDPSPSGSPDTICLQADPDKCVQQSRIPVCPLIGDNPVTTCRRANEGDPSPSPSPSPTPTLAGPRPIPGGRP